MNDKLFNELLYIFPNKLLKDFSKKMLYDTRKRFEKELKNEIPNGMTLKEFLIKKYNFKDASFNSFDYKTIKIIKENYEGKGNFTRKIFEKIENVTKQRIEQKLKKTLEKQIVLNWEVEDLNNFENLILEKLIKNKNFEYEDKKIFFYIIQNGNECLILIYDKINKKYKTITNQNNIHIKNLIQNNFYKYTKEDFINIEYLKNYSDDGIVQISSKYLKKSYNQKKMLVDEYIEFLGYKYINPNKYYTDSKIKKILNKYIYYGTEKDVYIPTDSEDAQLLRILGNRYDNGVKDLITNLGYTYHIRDSYLRTLRTLNYFSNEKKEIFLPSIGLFYHVLCTRANRNDFLLEDYIKKLGFNRIENKDQKESEEKQAKKIDNYYESLKIQRTPSKSQLSQENLNFIKEIENKLESIESINEKEVLIKQRLTQGLFRTLLLKRECKCKICDITNETFLIASHIKPWTISDDQEKVDINNGFLLCPNHDKLFDKGYISFENNGNLKISKKLTNDNIKQFNLNKKMKININDEVIKYLEYHREECFID